MVDHPLKKAARTRAPGLALQGNHIAHHCRAIGRIGQHHETIRIGYQPNFADRTHAFPAKTEGLESYGVHVATRVPLQPHPNDHNLAYLKTKRDRMGHHLPGLGAGGVLEAVTDVPTIEEGVAR